MRREFILNISFLIIINIIIKPIYILAIEVNVQNAVGPEEYGLYFALFNFCFLFQIFGDLGLQNYNSKSVAENPKVVNSYLPIISTTKLILSLVFLVIIYVVAKTLNYPKAIYPILFIIAVNQVILSFLLYFRSNIAAIGKYRIDSILSVIDKILLIVILGYLLWLSPNKEAFEIRWFVIAQSFSLSFTAILAMIILFRNVPGFKLKLSFNQVIRLLKKSLPFALVIFLMTAYTRLDGIMLERLLLDNGNEAGLYAAGFRLLDAANMIGFLFAGLLLPMFASLLKNRNELRKLINTSFSFMYGITIILSISCLFFSGDIMQMLYPEHANQKYADVFSYLMIGYVAMGLGYIFGTLLTASGKLKWLNVVFAFGIVLNFTLNWIWIPQYQSIGAAWATILTQFLVLGGQVFLFYKYFRFPISIKKAFPYLLFPALVFGVFSTITLIEGGPWLAKMILGIILAFIISLVFKLIDLRNLKASLNA